MSDVTDADLIRLLTEIKRLALSKYPVKESAALDPTLCFRLGEIAGIADRAITQHRASSASSE